MDRSLHSCRHVSVFVHLTGFLFPIAMPSSGDSQVWQVIHISSLFLKIYFCLKGSVAEQRQRRVFRLLLHSPEWLQQLNLSLPEASSQEIVLDLPCGCRDLST